MHRMAKPAPAGQPQLGAIQPGLREAIAAGFEQLRLTERIQVLRRLLVPVGPMALLVVAGGAFAKYVRQARSPRMKLATEDVARLTRAQILELARYAEQSKPSALVQVMHVMQRASIRLRVPRVSPQPCCS